MPPHARVRDDRGGREGEGAERTYMGHANIATTMDRYGHLMPGAEDEAAALMEAYLLGAKNATHAAQA